MLSADARGLMPDQAVCSTVVAVPTIVVKPFPGKQDPLRVFVQWFGNSSDEEILIKQLGEKAFAPFRNMQFLFDVGVSVKNLHWMGHPELFKVILLSQVKEWPSKDAQRHLGEPDDWILWLTSAHYSTKQGDEVGPACFATPMTVMLADSTFGIITPRKYLDLNVLERERAIVNSRK